MSRYMTLRLASRLAIPRAAISKKAWLSLSSLASTFPHTLYNISISHHPFTPST